MLVLPSNGLLTKEAAGPLMTHFDFGKLDKLGAKNKSAISQTLKTSRKSFCQMTRILAEQGRGYLSRKPAKILLPPQSQDQHESTTEKTNCDTILPNQFRRQLLSKRTRIILSPRSSSSQSTHEMKSAEEI